MGLLDNIFSSKKVSALLRKAADFISEKDYKNSLQIYSEVLELEPANIDAKYGRAVCNFNLNNFPSAEKDFNDLVNADTQPSPNSFYYLAMIKYDSGNLVDALFFTNKFLVVSLKKSEGYHLRAKIKHDQKEYLQALDDAQKAFDLMPDSHDALYLLAKIHYELHEYKKAVVLFNKLIEVNSNYLNAFIYRGLSRQNLQEPNEALNDFDEAIKINPKSAEAHYGKSVTLYNSKQSDEALFNLNKAIDLNNNYYDAYLLRAEIYYKMDMPDESFKDYNKLIELEPSNPEFYFRSAKLKKALFDFKGAYSYCKKALELEEKIEYIVELSEIEEANENYTTALELVNKAITLNSKDHHLFIKRGILQFKNKSYHEALKDFNEVLKIDPKCCEAFYYRAKVKEVFSDTHGAMSDYTLALSNPDYFDAYLDRGKLRLEDKQFRAAELDFTKALKLRPQSSRIFFLRANALKNMGKNNEAIDDLDKAISLNLSYVCAYFMRGFLNFSIRRYKLALADWEQTLRLDKNYYSKLTPYIESARAKLA
ncbi:MAG: tetratricopeptide repeat protein [bacterium]